MIPDRGKGFNDSRSAGLQGGGEGEALSRRVLCRAVTRAKV